MSKDPMRNGVIAFSVNPLSKTFLALAVFAMSCMVVNAAYAQNLPEGPVVQARIVSEKKDVTPGETFWIGLRLDILKHWHVYWRNAGDAGTPPSVKWDLPEGVTVGEFNWPVPERMAEGPLMTFAYKNELLLPMQFTLGDRWTPGETVILKGKARWLVCYKICIPESAEVELALTVADASKTDTIWEPKIAQTVSHLPAAAPWPVGFSVADGTLTLSIEDAAMAAALGAAKKASVTFFPYEGNIISNPAQQALARQDEGFTLAVDLQDGAIVPDELSGILVLEEELDGGTLERAFEFTATEGSASALVGSGRKGSGGVTVLSAAFFAFLGGLILNIMPCVFPVLFMKALGFVSAADASHRAIRMQGIFYTSGVVVSFLSLALVLIGLRAGGAEIGWGFQLQSPVVIGFLAAFMLAIALNLSGVYEVEGRFVNLGSNLASKEGGLGSFFTGVLATVVATPCTAPFMGAALGFALTQTSLTALTVFLFLGLGMASPYLLLSFAPSLVKKLPKPGAWMDLFKQFLAFPMYATAAWLAWTFGQQVDAQSFLVFLFTLVILGLSFWVLGASETKSGRWPLIGHIIGIAGIVLVVASLFQYDGQAKPAASAEGGNDGGLAYSAFSPERLTELRGEGKPVFINFTAAWCISCLVNERVVFTQDAIAKAFDDKGITYLKGDWTNRDPVITRTLAEYDRAGVPLYLYFAPGVSEPQILPQILTEKIVLDAIGAN
ncbi:MAG: hypothetical protein EP347_07270 [Alphaproteobacteria bacterium]|nr:MAG: hypothetical protein EP347_07270 [Alphaproteobacteria bacterium]